MFRGFIVIIIFILLKSHCLFLQSSYLTLALLGFFLKLVEFGEVPGLSTFAISSW